MFSFCTGRSRILVSLVMQKLSNAPDGLSWGISGPHSAHRRRIRSNNINGMLAFFQTPEATLIRFEQLFGPFGPLVFLLGPLVFLLSPLSWRWHHSTLSSQPP